MKITIDSFPGCQFTASVNAEKHNFIKKDILCKCCVIASISYFFLQLPGNENSA